MSTHEQKLVNDRLALLGKKQCSRCRKALSLDAFPLNRRQRDGLNRYCEPCNKAYNAKWRKCNFGYKQKQNANWYQENKERISEKAKLTRKRDWVRRKVKNLKTYCKDKGILFDLEDHVLRLEKRFATGRCEMTGVEFEHLWATRDWNSPSIDRKIPALGYVYDNVRFVVWGLNVAMSDWGEEKTAQLMTRWLERRRIDAIDL